MAKLIKLCENNLISDIKVADIKINEIKNIISNAKECKSIDYIILFGSSLEERCNEESDIDIAIISNITRSRLYRAKDYRDFLANVYKYNLKQEYDIIQFNSFEDIKKHKYGVYLDIAEKGKIIYSRKPMNNLTYRI